MGFGGLKAQVEYLPDANTVVLLHMNETSGSTVLDASGNGYSGTAIGTTIVNGRFGKARSFNGTSDVVNTTFNGNFGTNPFTVEFWLYLNTLSAPSGHQNVISSRLPQSSNTWWVGIFGDGRINVDGGSGSQPSNPGDIAAGEWNHIAVTRNASNVLTIYKNGIAVMTGTQSGNFTGGTNVAIGAIFGGTEFVNGLIDEVRISNIARTPAVFEPTTQATNLLITQPFASTLQLTWTNGNGASRLVVGRGGGTVNQAPADGATYTASSSFSVGTDLGGGNYVVYLGSGNSVSVTDIQPGTNYEFFVFEYNGTGGGENYLTSTASGNPVSYTSSGSADTTPPVVASNSTPTTIAPNTNLVVTGNFTDTGGSGVNFVNLEYRAIAGTTPNDFITVNMVPATGSAFEYPISAIQVTELGIEYRFLVTDFASNDNSANQTLYRTRIGHGAGLPIPYTSPGRAISNYRIIAVPLELDNKSMNSVLGDELGSYDPTKWIMYRYDGTRFVELSGSTQFEMGKGYWLLTPNTTPLNSGPGTTANVSENNPFQITLAPGWNQIGNPYNFDISWADVLLANPGSAPNLGNNSKIRVYRGTASDVDELQKFEGGFVRNTSPSSLIIDIPIEKNASINGRKGQQDKIVNSLDQPSWEIMFRLNQGDMEYKLGGLGMHPEAAVGFDFHDDFNLPRFFEYLEVKFPKQRVGMTYTKDIVPTSENFIWEFSVESNVGGEDISIGWDNSYFGTSKEIYLLDVAEHRIVDMRMQENYKYAAAASKEFKVIYGNPDFVKDALIPDRIVLYDPYPNPFIDRVAVEYSLPKESVTMNAEISIYNGLGANLSTISTPRESGAGKWTWAGGENPSGLYFVRVRLGDQVVTKKILKR